MLIGSDLLRAGLAVVATACLVTGAPVGAVLVVATLLSVVGCVFRPAQMAWMPSLTSRPEELTAAKGTSSTIESLAFFVGPALGALLVTTTSVEVVFLLNAATFVLSAFLVWGIRPIAGPPPGDDDPADEDGDLGSGGPEEVVGAFAEMAGGFRHIRRDRDLMMVAVLVCAQTVVAGATIVSGVTFAVEILETGPAGVGIIDSVFGVGAILGGFYAIARSTRNRLAGDLALGTALWSLPLLLVVAYPSPATVFDSAVLLGFGNPLVDVNFATIVQRITPNAILGRVFGAYEAPSSAPWRWGRRACRSSSPGSGCGGRWPSWPWSSGCRHCSSSPGACASTPPCGHRPAPTCCAASRSSRRCPRPPSRTSRACSPWRRHPPARPSCARARCPTASW